MKKKETRDLTKAEEDVMQVLWKIKKGFVKDILAFFEDPKPAYNTISTIVRILEGKGFIDHRAFGKSHEYYPVISKEEYSRHVLGKLTKGYFSSSFRNLVSFMAEEENLSIRDLEEIKNMLKNHKSNKS